MQIFAWYSFKRKMTIEWLESMTRLESRFLVSRFESCKNRCCEDSTQVEFFTHWLDSTRVTITISDSKLEPESFLPNQIIFAKPPNISFTNKDTLHIKKRVFSTVINIDANFLCQSYLSNSYYLTSLLSLEPQTINLVWGLARARINVHFCWRKLLHTLQPEVGSSERLK